MKTLRTLFVLAAITALNAATPSVIAQPPPPDDGPGDPSDPNNPSDPDDPGGPPTPVADCPVARTATFPVGADNQLCLFQTEACGTAPRIRATGFHACDKQECSCTGNICYGQNSNTPSSGAPPLVALHFMANTQDLPWVVPVSTTVVQAAAGQITTFGVGDYRVKYLQVLRLQSPAGQQYFALFKVFKSDGATDVGDTIEDTDGYVGIRVSAPTGMPAGGYVDLNSNEPMKFQKLQKFIKADGTPGYVREAGAKLPIASAAGNAEKWFHLYGTVL